MAGQSNLDGTTQSPKNGRFELPLKEVNSLRTSSSSEVETLSEYHQETEFIKGAVAVRDTSYLKLKRHLDFTSQLSREESFEKALKEVDLNRYHDLYLAALKGNWETAKMIIDRNPEALTAMISMISMTVLHVAAYSCNYKFVEKLVEKMTSEQVAVLDVNGNTALHYAALTGVVDVAKALLRKSPGLTEVQGSQGFIPLLLAVVHGAAEGKEMVRFLASKTKNPFLEATSANLLLELTHAGFHDITLDLLRRFPEKATVTVYHSRSSILGILAVRPMDFRSGTRLNFWETWIYQLAPCQSLSGAKGDVEDPSENSGDPKDPNPQAWATRGFQFSILFYS